MLARIHALRQLSSSLNATIPTYTFQAGLSHAGLCLTYVGQQDPTEARPHSAKPTLQVDPSLPSHPPPRCLFRDASADVSFLDQTSTSRK
jgi:hypothetical protein